MRPFLWWMKELRLHATVPATRLIRVLRSCSRPLLQWWDPAFLQSGVRMGAIHRRHMITTDTSMTGWGVPHKPSGRFTVAHPGQACAQSSPVVPGQVPFLEGSSRSGNTEPRGRFSVETEAQAGGKWTLKTVRRYPRFGICLAKRRWISLLLKSHPSARSGSP